MTDEAAAARLFPEAANPKPAPTPGHDAPIASRLFPQADADAKAKAEQQAQPKPAVQQTKPGEQPKPAQDQVKPAQQTPEAIAKAAGAIATTLAEQAGLAADHPDTASFSKLAAEAGISPAAAAKFAAWDQQRTEAHWENQFQTWDKATHSEFLASELQDARSVVQRFGDAELDALLTDWGLGSHPAVVRFCRNVARGRK